jgi:hypothetical protein
MVALSALGVIVLMPLSYGNNPYRRPRQLFAVVITAVYTV